MVKIDIKKAVGYGWDSIKKDFWYFVAIALIYETISAFPSFIKNESISSFVAFAVMLLTILMIAGQLKISLEYYKGNKIAIENILTQTKYFWRIVGASILIALIVMGGFLLLIVPGIYWALKYQFALNLIVDKDLSISEAMTKSGEITKGVKLRLLWFDIITGLVSLLGLIAFGIGILVALPVVWLAEIHVYKQLLAENNSKEETKE